MKKTIRRLSLAVAALMALSLSGCAAKTSASAPASSAASSAASTTAVGGALAFDNAKWNYDETNNVYWRVGVAYCTTPQDANYETLGIYVPGAYMNGTKNADGTYTCTVNASGKAGSYTASTAPVVVPVNTPGYAASAAPTTFNYNSVASYLDAGFVYLQAGARGRSNMMGGAASASASSASGGAPWGVTDFKAAIRYYRYNAAVLPGSANAIYTFGMSGGGAQSALLGSTGDSALYEPYLTAIGAAMKTEDGKTISDAVTGSMCWCPITSLDEADAAYEWNMGQFTTTGVRADTSFGSALSEDLAASYADYINALGLKDSNGSALTLTQSANGIYQAGSYYDYILSVVETSLNNFLADTAFPYTEQVNQAQFPGGSNGTFGAASGASSTGAAASAAGASTGTDAVAGATSGTSGASGSAAPAASAASSGTDAVAGATSTANSGTRPAGGPMGAGGPGSMAGPSAQTTAGNTYQTAQEYIDSLNGSDAWITYDAATNTAKVSSVEAFVEHCKAATKSIGAFDEVDRGQGENSLFGDGSATSVHFDATLAQILADNASDYAKYSDWQASYVSDCQSDLTSWKDSVGTSLETRVDMYNPLYFLTASSKGYQTSTVAKYWRIRTGINQSDTALTVETNLALALQNAGVSSVDFATIWGQKHTMAERTGDSTSNFIAWVNECAAKA